MTNKQDYHGEAAAGEQRVPRTSHSLASAPLRLLSHSFHSTNAHSNVSTSTFSSSSSSSSSAACPSIIPQYSDVNTPSDLKHQEYFYHDHPSSSTDDHLSGYVGRMDVEASVFQPQQQQPGEGAIYSLDNCSTTLPSPHPPHAHRPPPHSRSSDPYLIHLTPSNDHGDQSTFQQTDAKNKAVVKLQEESPQDNWPLSPLQLSSPPCSPSAVYLQHPYNAATAITGRRAPDLKTLLSLTHPDASSHLGRGYARLAALLQPYDIRMGIFGQLSLQDIFHCQLTSHLLNWATSDQLLWKQLALNLIQGEFYFDVPRTLPPKIPSWKHFCKRHMLRQQNWRKGLVQDVIALDDNYKKLTTLQITAPYILTGCDDGRIHLWHLNERRLLHCFNVRGEITWVEHLQDLKVVAGLGYDIEKCKSQIRLFSTESGEQIGFYEEPYWDLAIAAINNNYLVASDGDGRFTVWNWKTAEKVSHFRVDVESSITEALYFVQDTILELHYDGLIRLFSISGECFGRFTLENILPNHQVSFCWLHNDFSMVVWEESNTMAHIRFPLLQQGHDQEMAMRAANSHPNLTSTSTSSSPSSPVQAQNPLNRPITQEEWDAQGVEVYWRHQLQHTCNFAAMGGGRFQLLYVQIFENMMDQVPIRVHSLRHNVGSENGGDMTSQSHEQQPQQRRSTITATAAGVNNELSEAALSPTTTAMESSWQHHGEYVTAHSDDPELDKIIQALRPSRIDCDPEYIVVGLLEGGVRLLQFAPKDEDML